jgi:hypothetical protein
MKRMRTFTNETNPNLIFMRIKNLAVYLVILILFNSCVSKNSGKNDSAKAKDWSIKYDLITKNPILSEHLTHSLSSEEGLIIEIDLEIVALTGKIGNLRERLLNEESFIGQTGMEYLSGKMPVSIKTNLLGLTHTPADLSNLETQLFLSKNVRLLIDKSSIIPVFTEIDGYGLTLYDEGAVSFTSKAYDPLNEYAVYFSQYKMLAAWLIPNKTVNVKLYYSIPFFSTEGKLQFYNLPTIDLQF